MDSGLPTVGGGCQVTNGAAGARGSWILENLEPRGLPAGGVAQALLLVHLATGGDPSLGCTSSSGVKEDGLSTAPTPGCYSPPRGLQQHPSVGPPLIHSPRGSLTLPPLPPAPDSILCLFSSRPAHLLLPPGDFVSGVSLPHSAPEL